jgi:hypothetical protein
MPLYLIFLNRFLFLNKIFNVRKSTFCDHGKFYFIFSFYLLFHLKKTIESRKKEKKS